MSVPTPIAVTDESACAECEPLLAEDVRAWHHIIHRRAWHVMSKKTNIIVLFYKQS